MFQTLTASESEDGGSQALMWSDLLGMLKTKAPPFQDGIRKAACPN